MSTYGTLTKVRGRLPLVEISSTSTPTETTVQAWLDEAEDMINGVLRAGGLTPPYTDAEPVRILGRWVTDYAEGRVRKAIASELGDGAETDGDSLLEGFDATIKDMRTNTALWGDILSAGGRAGNGPVMISGIGDASTAARDPWFTTDEAF